MRVKDARQTFLGFWFRLVLDGEELQVWGDGTADSGTSTTSTTPSARSCSRRRATRPSGKIYNLGDDEIVSLKDLAELVVTVNGSGEYRRRCRSRPSARRSTSATTTATTGGSAPSSAGRRRSKLAEGMTRSLDFYREHGAALLVGRWRNVPFLDLARGTSQAIREELDGAVAAVLDGGSSSSASR